MVSRSSAADATEREALAGAIEGLRERPDADGARALGRARRCVRGERGPPEAKDGGDDLKGARNDERDGDHKDEPESQALATQSSGQGDRVVACFALRCVALVGHAASVMAAGEAPVNVLRAGRWPAREDAVCSKNRSPS